MSLDISKLAKANVPSYMIEISGVSDALNVVQFGVRRDFQSCFTSVSKSNRAILKLILLILSETKLHLLFFSRKNFRVVHGIISRFEYLGLDNDVALYRVDINPNLFRLSQNYQSRIFQNVSAVDILTEVLQSSNLSSDSYEISCNGEYDPI
jgi:uncharacterized protein involved in type VI secretion and phage assembly